MGLSVGARVGPYEVVAPLGAGAMGEVYRARDARLSREVAIKLLPPAFSRDADRVRRFEQEARAVGALSHPSIVAVFDVGLHDASPYLVSELLEGETLGDRLQKGPLSQRKAIEIALQIAQGLAAAHERGIVHRDLKPENVFLTRDGSVKILDFGLAKLRDADGLLRDSGAPGAPTAPTLPAGTEPGAVLGTVGYMAPEQVRGKPADHRADIFSLGVVLYEMVAHKQPFRGESAVETLHAIVKDVPPELATLTGAIPPALARVIEHCLEKNPEDRFQSARDLAFDLRALGGSSGFHTGPRQLAPPTRLVARPRFWMALLGGLGALGVALGAGYVIGARGSRGVQPGFHQLTFRRGTIVSARFSPDGRTIVYGAAWGGAPAELFSTRAESPESRPLGLGTADLLAISPSGEMAVALGSHLRGASYWVRTGTLARLPLVGGAPRELLEDVEQADWAPSGEDLAVVRESGGRTRLELPIGHVLYETDGWVSYPRISPDGARVAFLDHPLLDDDAGGVVVVDRAGKRRVLSTGWQTTRGLAWSARGDEVWFTGARSGSARSLYAVDLRGRERLVLRALVALTLQDIARDGQVLMTREDMRTGIVGLAPGETRERDLSWLDWSRVSDLSNDGKVLLFDEEGEGGGPGYSVYLRKTDGSPAVRLGDGGGLGLSPDGKWVVALLLRALPAQLVLLPTGAGAPRPLQADAINHFDARWFPDGRRLLFEGAEPGRGARLYVQDSAGGPPHPVTPEGVGRSRALSPDGKQLAARAPDGQLAIYPVDGRGAPRPLPGLAGLAPIRWSGDGRALFLFKAGELPLRVERYDLATGRREPWQKISPGDGAGVVAIGSIALSADGRGYACGYLRQLSDLILVEGLR